jgi:hypothetical protein
MGSMRVSSRVQANAKVDAERARVRVFGVGFCARVPRPRHCCPLVLPGPHAAGRGKRPGKRPVCAQRPWTTVVAGGRRWRRRSGASAWRPSCRLRAIR